MITAVITALLPVSPASAADPLPDNSREDLTFACPAGEVPDAGFTDTSGSTFEADIDCLAWWDITQGGPAGLPADQYGPTLNVRRDQMASFIARAIDATTNPLPAYDGSNEFSDVGDENVHIENINRLADAGVVQGGPGGAPADVYGPDQNITRAQMASFIARAIEYVTGAALDETGDYFDDDETAQPHEANINRLAGAGIVQGRSEGVYAPFDNVRREAMAAFIMRMLDFLTEGGFAEPPTPVVDEVTLESASGTDADSDGVLSAGDTVVLNFSDQVALQSSITLCNQDDPAVCVTLSDEDGAADPGGDVDSTWELSDDGMTVTITLNEDPGDALSGALSVGACSGIFADLNGNGTVDDGEPEVDCAAGDIQIPADVFGGEEPGTVTVTVNNANVQQNSSLTGVITGENIQSVSVSGPCVDTQNVGRDAGGNFTLALKPGATVGECELTFVTTFLNGTTETDTVTVTVTAPTTFAIGSPVTTQFNPASTGALPNQGRETYTFTLPADFPGPVDITLVPGANLRLTSGGVEFLDANDDAQADGLGDPTQPAANNAPCGGIIEQVEGVAPAHGSYINNQPIPGDRIIEVTIDSTTPNSVCAVLVFSDTGNDNRLAVNATDIPTEPFALAGGKIWYSAEAPFGTDNILVAASAADAEEGTTRTEGAGPINALTSFPAGFDPAGGTTPQPTPTGTKFEWDSNDVFQLGGVVITQDQFESIIGQGDAVTVQYDPAPGGVSTFNITADAGWNAPGAPTITVINNDGDAQANDVRVRFTVPAGNSANATYLIQRASSAGPDNICGTADDVTSANATYTTVASVRRLPTNIVQFIDEDVPNGCYFYRVRVTNPVSGANSDSPVTGPLAIPGGADTGIPTIVQASADDNGNALVLDTGDILFVLFDELMNLGAGDSIQVQDADGQFFSIVLGTGNTFTVTNAGGQSLLTITMTATPDSATFGDADANTGNNDTVIEYNRVQGAQTGLLITNTNGVTDLAGNSLGTTINGVDDNVLEPDNSTLPASGGDDGRPVIADDSGVAQTNPGGNVPAGATQFTICLDEAIDRTDAADPTNYTVRQGNAPASTVNPVTNVTVSSSSDTTDGVLSAGETAPEFTVPNPESARSYAEAWTCVLISVQQGLANNATVYQTVKDLAGNEGDPTVGYQLVGNATAPAIIDTPDPLALNEGANGNINVSLSVAPTSNVTINVASNNADCTVNPTTLVFTPANFSTPQVVNVAVAEDPGVAPGDNETCIISYTTVDAGSADEYDPVAGQTTVNVTDNDAADITIPDMREATSQNGTNQVLVTYSEAIDCKGGQVATANQFAIVDQTTANNQNDAQADNIAQSGANSCLLTFNNINNAFDAGDAFRIDYTEASEAAAIEDLADNNAQTPESQRGSNTGGTTGPSVTGIVADAATDTVTVTFNEPVRCNTISPTVGDDFTATRNGTGVAFDSVQCQGVADATVVYDLNVDILVNDVIQFNLLDDRVADNAGNLNDPDSDSDTA